MGQKYSTAIIFGAKAFPLGAITIQSIGFWGRVFKKQSKQLYFRLLYFQKCFLSLNTINWAKKLLNSHIWYHNFPYTNRFNPEHLFFRPKLYYFRPFSSLFPFRSHTNPEQSFRGPNHSSEIKCCVMAFKAVIIGVIFF